MAKADEVYHDLLKDILQNGKLADERTGTGAFKIFGRMIRFENISENFPILTTKKVFTRGTIEELLWFLSGDTNAATLSRKNVNIWNGDAYKYYANNSDCASLLTKEEFKTKLDEDDEVAAEWGELGPIYGAQWTNWNSSINQIQNLIDELRINKASRRLIVSAWNVDKIPSMKLPPCHYGFQLDVDESQSVPKLNLMFNMRSNDFFLGAPLNIASYGLLLMMIADQVDMIPGDLIGSLGNVHIYKDHLPAVIQQLQNDTTKYESPTVCLTGKEKPNSIFEYTLEHFVINNYQSYPTIKAPLSN